MNRTFSLLLLPLLFGAMMAFSSCEKPNSTASTHDQGDSTALATAPAATVSLNPNLASKEELEGLPHVNAKLAGLIVANRPFLGMGEFDPFLQAHLSEEQRRELYVQLFLPIDLNTAKRAEIMLVPGIGERMAHEFEEYRPYKAMAQFHREIGKYVEEEEVQRFAQYVFVPVNLNDASDEEILAIPGVGKRMLHEFKEYRPYSNIEQFNREIGKYVDEQEVARFRRYVFVPEGA